MDNMRMKPLFPFVLDHKPGFFLSWFLYRLFKRVRFDENMIEKLKQMHKDGTVVYAIKYSGRLDYLLYHYRFRRSRLPYPKIAFDLNMAMLLPLSQLVKVLGFYLSYFFKHRRLPSPFKTGFFREAISSGDTSLLSLVDPKGFTRQFIHAEKDSIHFLLESQKDMERPIYIVPLLVLYKKTPEKEYSNLRDIFFGFKDKPGFIRKIGLFFRHNRRAFIDFGKILNVKTYLQGQPVTRPAAEMTSEIRQLLIESIDAQKRVILGPIMKSRQQLKERVLKDPGITKTIEEKAAGNPRRLREVRKKAEAYFEEIAADYNITYIQVFQMVLSWFWKKIYEGIDVDQAEMAVVREWARKGPIIYIPSHKSHIDYLVLNYVLFKNNMHIPRIAAGKNLTFWPMGHIFRKSGAFFLRRSFKGAKLYAEVFERYIKSLLEEGHPLEFFIEGGRSRSGKLILPKIGFLSILMRAQQDGYCDDLVFVPASISYDRILEEKSYLHELEGKEKEAESFKQMLRARHFLKRKYGKIYIRFGQPLSLRECLAQEGDRGDKIQLHLAFHFIRAINKATLVTPLALASTAILTKHRRGFYLHEITDTIETLLSILKNRGIPTATTLNHIETTINETLSLLINRKVVKFLEDADGAETFYYVDDEKKPELEYYKNSIIHCFIAYAFVAVSLLTGTKDEKGEEEILDDYVFLKRLFWNEFIYDEEKDERAQINEVIAYFLKTAYIEKKEPPSGYRLTRLGYDKLQIWAGLAKTFLESYWIAASSFIQQKKTGAKKGDLLKNMNYLGLRFHKLGLIDHIESVSRLNFINAVKFLNGLDHEERINSEGGQKGASESLSLLSQRLHALSHYRG
jgi:glycerol-3-phosphate O-acyltransferase